MLNETNSQNAVPEIDEEKLKNTQASRGFEAMVFMSDIMQRYPFSLRETKGGRIFVDDTLGTKLRRKVVRGQPDQNYIFECYKTIDNNAVPVAEVEISSKGFSPSMLIAAVAANIARDTKNAHNTMAMVLLQLASALLQDGQKMKAGRKQLNPEGLEHLNELYDNVANITVRANVLKGVEDILNHTVRDDEAVSSGFAEAFRVIGSIMKDTSGKWNEDDKQEARVATNLMLSSVTNLGFSPVFTDILEMAEVYKENLAESAMTELGVDVK